MTPSLLPLAEIDPDRDRCFGGKACGLARLLRAGANVPDGFALAAMKEPPEAWPASLREQFLAAAARLCEDGPVAVRSSALVEDGREHSYAGLFVSVLHVTDAEAALAAARRCISSGGGHRVLAYSGARDAMAVGVLVQAMVVPAAAGVVFTRDPEGRDPAVVLEAVADDAESLMGGRAAPERWRLYRTGLGTWEGHLDRARADGAEPLLSEARAVELAMRARRLEELFSTPLDLEWALPHRSSLGGDAEPAPWWLQARPITAAREPPAWTVERSVEGADDGPVTVWSNWNVRETMPEPLHPLTWSIWRESIIPFLTERFFGVPRRSPVFREVPALDLVQGRVYFNLNGVLATPFIGRLLRPTVARVDARAGATIRDLLQRRILTPRRYVASRRDVPARLLLSAVRSALLSLRALRPEACLRGLEKAAERIRRRPPVEDLTAQELQEELMLWDSPAAGELRESMSLLVGSLFASLLAERLFSHAPEAQRMLTVGTEGNPTTEIAARIDRLAQAARPLAALFCSADDTGELLAALTADAAGRRWLEDLADFLAFCGQRGPREFDLAAPRWSDDPTMILDLVRARLAAPQREAVDVRLRRLGEERRLVLEEAVRQAPFWKRPLLRRVASDLPRFLPLREAPKHHGLWVFQRVRESAREIGRRLQERGVLEAPEDVFLLHLNELRPLLEPGEAVPEELPSMLAARRAELERFARRPAPDFVRSDGVPVTSPSEEPGADGELRGTGVSVGTGSGPVRVLRLPDPRGFDDGDVLVVSYADPGWTPLFPRAAALIMEVGGTMCHAAVVARELGIPAVFGVAEATSLLRDGQTVEVDAVAGRVRVL